MPHELVLAGGSVPLKLGDRAWGWGAKKTDEKLDSAVARGSQSFLFSRCFFHPST
jgi:hypothetical protein